MENVTSAEMTEALVEINDRLGAAARAGEPVTFFFCECGDCFAEDVLLSLDGYEEIRDREDLIFAPGHDAPRRYRKPSPSQSGYPSDVLEAVPWRDVFVAALLKASGTRGARGHVRV
jgi:hypothetical protein